jgi:HEAT repeat protein
MYAIARKERTMVGSKYNVPDINGQKAAQVRASSSPDIDALIAQLDDDSRMARQRARETLVDIGHPAVDPLINTLLNPKSDERLRWETAKALSEIGDPSAAPALVKVLEDDWSFGVRWLAAEGLISMADRGLPTLLEALIVRPESAWLREGAHHVLRILAAEGLHYELAPVVAALDDIEPVLELPLAARTALTRLSKS